MDRRRIITLETDFGAGRKGAKLGPQKLLETLSKETREKISSEEPLRIQFESLQADQTHALLKHAEDILPHLNNACSEIQSVIQLGQIPIIISGDHSNAIAGVSALKNAFPQKKIGIIWVDAHADLHTPFTTPSGNVHGMPLAALLGLSQSSTDHNQPDKTEIQVWQQLMQIGDQKISPKLQADHIVFIGLRDYEKEEASRLNELAIPFYTPDHIRNLGIEAIYEKAIQQLEDCDSIYLSFDVDSLDPELSIGTGTPVPDGLTLDEGAYILKNILQHPKLACLEITEINPLLDRNKPMESVISRLLERII